MVQCRFRAKGVQGCGLETVTGDVDEVFPLRFVVAYEGQTAEVTRWITIVEPCEEGFSFCEPADICVPVSLCGGVSFCEPANICVPVSLCGGGSFCEPADICVPVSLCGGGSFCEPADICVPVSLFGGGSFCEPADICVPVSLFGFCEFVWWW